MAKVFDMLRNNIKLGIRRLISQKVISLINIIGLAVGFAASATIFTYISFELSFDNFHSQKDSIYRIHLGGADPQKTFPALGPAMLHHFPQVVQSVRLKEARVVFGYDDVRFLEERAYFVDSSFFDVFGYPLLSGEADNVLSAPNSVVISEAASMKYFGHINSVGKILYNLNQEPYQAPYQITGVFKNTPQNSHLQFDFLISYCSLPESLESYPYRWAWRGIYTYVLVTAGSDIGRIERQFDAFMGTFRGLEHNSIPEKSLMKLVRIDKIHNWEGIKSFTEKYGDINILRFLMALGIIILLISMVNYVNLATARASDRAGEIGLRKVLGAQRSQIISQYFTESIILIAVSFFFSIIGYVILINYLDRVLSTPLSRVEYANKPAVLFMIASYLLLTLTSLVYPAFILSSYKPAENLARNDQIKRNGLHFSVRQILVVVQFSATIGLLAVSLTIYNQIDYMRSQSLGLNIDRTLVIKPPELAAVNENIHRERIQYLFSKLRQLTQIESITASDMIPGRPFNTYWYNLQLQNTLDQGHNQDIEFAISRITDNFFDFFGIELVCGKNFTLGSTPVKNQAIINELSSRILGYTDPTDAIGVKLKLEKEYEIIGVVANYHHYSLKDAIVPTVFLNQGIERPYYSIKISNAGHIDQLVSSIQRYWQEVYQNDIFDYYFLDTAFNAQYRNELQLSKIVMGVTSIAIIICCLGLFGLMSYILKRKLREFAIRKILGGSPMDILKLIIAGRQMYPVVARFT